MQRKGIILKNEILIKITTLNFIEKTQDVIRLKRSFEVSLKNLEWISCKNRENCLI